MTNFYFLTKSSVEVKIKITGNFMNIFLPEVSKFYEHFPKKMNSRTVIAISNKLFSFYLFKLFKGFHLETDLGEINQIL